MNTETKYEEERAILEGLAHHDPVAIEAIYRENFEIIQAYVVRNGGIPDDARDIFQEALIILFEKSGTEGFELNCKIRTFLYSVCRRLWLKKMHGENKMFASAIDINETQIAVEEDLDKHDRRNLELTLLGDALNMLGEPCKSLLEAFYLQKKSMPEIATSFGYTNADNAKTQKYKCLVRLKKIFFSQYNKNKK